jgi:competence protein ComEC
MEMVPVNTLILPAAEEDDNGYKSAILACATRHGTEVRALENNAEASCGRLKVQLYRLSDSGDRNESGLMASLSVGETKLLVTADASKKLERKLVQQEDLSGTDILVVGHHGSKYASAPELLEKLGGRIAVISVGYNTYGHPAPETLDALRENGYEILRTDENGTVELRLENDHG